MEGGGKISLFPWDSGEMDTVTSYPDNGDGETCLDVAAHMVLWLLSLL